MKIDGRNWRTIWLENDGLTIGVIDQTRLPHLFSTNTLRSWEEVSDAIRNMIVRGAPLIGVSGAYGLMLALMKDPSDASLDLAFKGLCSSRPTAVNLRWALERVFRKVKPLKLSDRAHAARVEADLIAEEDVVMCELIGDFGLEIIRKLSHEKSQDKKESPINILTHCNAGWLATVDWGTALAPIYKAHRAGLNIHVWVDETRPRNQGAGLTAFELLNEGVPHTVIVDNAGGHLMQNGLVDAVIVGADRVTSSGDVCNKIGTYLKALSAYDNHVPFYAAMPSSTIDWLISDGLSEIPIEERSVKEVTLVQGLIWEQGDTPEISKVQISPSESSAFNPAFDVTPARLVTSLITEKGVIPSSEHALSMLKLKLDND